MGNQLDRRLHKNRISVPGAFTACPPLDLADVAVTWPRGWCYAGEVRMQGWFDLFAEIPLVVRTVAGTSENPANRRPGTPLRDAAS